MRSDRLLATLLLLQTHGRLPAPEIARRLEVSTRTVARDVEALSAAGVPVYAERGRAGGVVLLPGFRTDVTGLTDEEMRALFVLGGTGSEERGLAPAMASAARKLLAAVPEARRAGIDAARRRVLVEQQGWRRPSDDVVALPALEEAVAADERVRIRYRSGWRTVDPYGLVSKAGVWYLVAAHRGQPRLYRVSRVEEVAATGVPARRPDDRTLEEVWADHRDRIERAPDPVVVRLRVDRDWLGTLERVGATWFTGPPVPVDGGGDDGGGLDDGSATVVLDVPFRAVGAVPALLMGFGATVEVLDPPELRERMVATAEDVLALYQ